MLHIVTLLEGSLLKKLHDAVDRFAMSHPRFGIPGLIRYIVIGTAAVYLLIQFSSYSAVAFLGFNWGLVLKGELWRLVTFLFLPETLNPISLILSLYFTYFIGTLLEREWGTAKFSLYYLSGVVLTLLTGIISHYAWGPSTIYGAFYVNMAMFLALASLYPDMRVLLYGIIPLKVKWLAYVDAALFAYDIAFSLVTRNWLQAILPIIALLNYFLFFGDDLLGLFRRKGQQVRYRTSAQTINFKKAQKEVQQRKGYLHKCAVCGITDADDPNMEFRYCSKCNGYYCYCSKHINNHTHVQ